MSLLVPEDEEEIARLFRWRESLREVLKGKEGMVQDTMSNSGHLQHFVRDGEMWQETEAEIG